MIFRGDNGLIQVNFSGNSLKPSSFKLSVWNLPCYFQIRKDIVADVIPNSVLVWNVQTDAVHLLRVFAWQNGYEFGVLFCAMKGLISRLG
jgi:hypothetical protein